MHFGADFAPEIEFIDKIREGLLLKQLTPSDELEASLLRAREIAEKRGMAVVVYFIDMAISEAALKSPSTETGHIPQAPKQPEY